MAGEKSGCSSHQQPLTRQRAAPMGQKIRRPHRHDHYLLELLTTQRNQCRLNREHRWTCHVSLRPTTCSFRPRGLLPGLSNASIPFRIPPRWIPVTDQLLAAAMPRAIWIKVAVQLTRIYSIGSECSHAVLFASRRSREPKGAEGSRREHRALAPFTSPAEHGFLLSAKR